MESRRSLHEEEKVIGKEGRKIGWDGKTVAADLSSRRDARFGDVEVRDWLEWRPGGRWGATGRAGSADPVRMERRTRLELDGGNGGWVRCDAMLTCVR